MASLVSQVAQKEADMKEEDDEMDKHTDCFYSYAGHD